MFRSGIILALASFFGFFANLVFSVFLEKGAYGQVVTLFSIISILVLVAPVGTNAYFLSHREVYRRSANAIIFFPVFISFLMGAAFLVADFSLLMGMVMCLLVISTLSVQGIMASQIEQNGPQAAIYQALQPVLKSVAALVVLAGYLVGTSKGQSVELMASGLIIICLVVMPFALLRILDLHEGGALFNLDFFKKFTRKQWISLLSFWTSSVLGIASSLGIIPLVSYFHGYTHAAYLGIYFIFWSGGNILITLMINNHYWPKCCAVRSVGGDERGVLLKSLRASISIALCTFAGTVVVALLAGRLIWEGYPNVDSFLVIAAVALGIRPLSAWVGMMVLSNDRYIASKVKIQLLVALAMCGCVVAFNITDSNDLAWLVVFLELIYFLGYFLSAIGYFREKQWFMRGSKV